MKIPQILNILKSLRAGLVYRYDTCKCFDEIDKLFWSDHKKIYDLEISNPFDLHFNYSIHDLDLVLTFEEHEEVFREFMVTMALDYFIKFDRLKLILPYKHLLTNQYKNYMNSLLKQYQKDISELQSITCFANEYDISLYFTFFGDFIHFLERENGKWNVNQHTTILLEETYGNIDSTIEKIPYYNERLGEVGEYIYQTAEKL